MKFIKNNAPHLLATVICYTLFAILVNGIGPKILGCNPFLVIAFFFGVERCLTTNFPQKVKRVLQNAHKLAKPLFDFGEPNTTSEGAAYAVATAVKKPPAVSVNADTTTTESLFDEIEKTMAAEQSVLDADFCQVPDAESGI